MKKFFDEIEDSGVNESLLMTASSGGKRKAAPHDIMAAGRAGMRPKSTGLEEEGKRVFHTEVVFYCVLSIILFFNRRQRPWQHDAPFFYYAIWKNGGHAV